jgi:hypothetical protein
MVFVVARRLFGSQQDCQSQSKRGDLVGGRLLYRSARFSKAKTVFQSFFMLMTVHPSFFASAMRASLKAPIFESAP